LTISEDILHPDHAAIEAAKAQSTAQLLFRCARLLNEQSLALLRARTGQDVRPAHATLFPHIDLEGTRLTELARRVGVSKQAVGQLVDDLERMGAVERIPDPADGRARLVRFARGPDGEHAILAGLRVLGEVEARLAAELGEEGFEALHAQLARMLPLLESGRLPDLLESD
jgi:DNA-binding MarR family transcriptional regulator